MPDPVARLNAALDGRYRIDRELGEGRWRLSTWPTISGTGGRSHSRDDGSEPSRIIVVLDGLTALEERLAVAGGR